MPRSDGFPVKVRLFPSTLESIPLIVAVIITSSALGELTVIELILSVEMDTPMVVRMATMLSQ
jgi:hypothetical protein